MEIEKKFLIKNLPENLEQYESAQIEQGYLSTDPTIRVRRRNDEYILTYKSRKGVSPADGTVVNQEVELPLTESSYKHLCGKTDGRIIKKTRYLIPIENDLTIELDIFHEHFEGRILAEIEFPSLEEAERFIKPKWLGENVSNDVQYSNAYMSKQ